MPSLELAALALSFVLGLALGALAAAAYFSASRAAALARLDAAERVLSGVRCEPSLESVISPLAAALQDHQRELRALEERRLVEGTRTGDALARLSAETARLVGALRPPHGRGRWGELTLRRVAELAGMSAHCDFTEQASFETEEGRLRPDMVVRLPGGRSIVVDAKAPLGDGLEALELEAGARRTAALAQHARLVRRHVEALASRSYANLVPGAPAFVVLFLPSDALLAAAAEGDRSLVETARRRPPSLPCSRAWPKAGVRSDFRKGRSAWRPSGRNFRIDSPGSPSTLAGWAPRSRKPSSSTMPPSDLSTRGFSPTRGVCGRRGLRGARSSWPWLPSRSDLAIHAANPGKRWTRPRLQGFTTLTLP